MICIIVLRYCLKKNILSIRGISNKELDIQFYKELGKYKEIVTAKKFYDLCKAKRLGHQHIILKKDNTSIQKLNILNNLNLLTNSNTLYCSNNRIYKNLKCDCMIGFTSGNITLALQKLNKCYFPLSSLDFNIKDSGEILFEIVLIASKKIGADKYSTINMKKIEVSRLPETFKNLFYSKEFSI